MREIDPVVTVLRWRQVIQRRSYHVRSPNSLWHLDGNHTLLLTGFQELFCLYTVPQTIGSFIIDDGNGSENVSVKMDSCFFNLCRVYSNLPKMAIVGEFLWNCFLEDRTQQV